MKKIFVLFFLSKAILGYGQQEKLAVYFDFDNDKLTPTNKQQLDELVKKEPDLTFELKGYADFIGSNEYNVKLSQRRVASVKQYLIEQGIKEDALKEAIGLGETTEFGERANNRKVAIFYTIPVIVEEVAVVSEKKAITAEKVEQLKVGETLALENLEFIPGRHVVMEYSEPELNDLLAILKEKPSLKIKIQGHVCCMGENSQEDGLDWDTGKHNLSEARAKYVVDFLVENGISKKRLSYEGFANTKPLVEEITEANMQKNRRVEILIVEK